MKKYYVLLLTILMNFMVAEAQIGYQISLLNTATGEPRANETVVVSVTLSNSVGETLYSETKSATTNDFGVLSLSIGNANTFKDVDLSKMPFFIEVTANGVMIGKSQMLSVPVAEVAKRIAPMDKSLIVGTWKNIRFSENEGYYLYTFMDNNIVSITEYSPFIDNGVISHWTEKYWGTFKYVVEGFSIYIYGRYEVQGKIINPYKFEVLKLLDGILFNQDTYLKSFEKIQ